VTETTAPAAPAEQEAAPRLSVIGTGYLGATHAACMAELGFEVLGVDEHLWHHVSTKPVADGGRGPKELTGMVDLTRDATGRVRARLLDLVPGRSSKA